MKMEHVFGAVLAMLTYSSCCLFAPDEKLDPCTDTGYPLTVRGYYNLETCDIYYELVETECGWTEDGTSILPCPGLEPFRLVIEDRFVELFSTYPLENTIYSLRVWYDESCPYPGDYDHSHGTDYYAVVLLSEEHWECIKANRGFFFRFRVWI